jgi:site-specific recombinase XerD
MSVESNRAVLPRTQLRALRRLQREQELNSPLVFTSERGTPFTKRGFQAMVERAGKATGFDMKIHPHMLRHACGFKLANDGVDTSIQCVTPSWHRLGSKAYSGIDCTVLWI